MTSQEMQLWQRIQGFRLDDPQVAFKFSDRLARENGWTIIYTKRVIEEYRKFIFLCCISEHGVTPSDPVDQAWHLHLTFTRSYWTDLCKNTLQKEIHHNPTKGGKQEANKFDGYYTSSHKLYVDKFGTIPPADIWHDNKTRFSDINFRRVNTGKYWLVRKPVLTVWGMVSVMLVISIAVFVQAIGNFIFPASVALLVLALYINDKRKNPDKQGTDGKNGGSGCGSTGGCNSGDSSDYADNSHHHSSDSHHGDSGCNSSSGCSGCSSSGCSGCGGGGD
jgi:hypothetical protein